MRNLPYATSSRTNVQGACCSFRFFNSCYFFIREACIDLNFMCQTLAFASALMNQQLPSTHQIVLAEVKDQVENWFVFVVFVGLRPTNFYQVDDVLMLEELQNANFTESCDGKLKEHSGTFRKMASNIQLGWFNSRLPFRSPWERASSRRTCCRSWLGLWTPRWWSAEHENMRNEIGESEDPVEILPKCSLTNFRDLLILDGLIAVRKII